MSAGRKLVAALQQFVDALGAIGICPLIRERIFRFVAGDAGVRGGEKSRWRIEGVGQVVEGDVGIAAPAEQEIIIAPFVARIQGVMWERLGEDARSAQADGYLAHSVITDVTLIVGIDDILRGPAPLRKRRREFSPVGCGVHCVERNRVQRCVIERPLECDGARVFGEDGIEQRAVVCETHVVENVSCGRARESFRGLR